MCGVVGVFNHRDAAQIVYAGLFSLQHRGQEAAGIATVGPDQKLLSHVGTGLVPAAFQGEALNHLKGRIAVGHVRYTTAGASTLKNAQPLLCAQVHGEMAIAHNGNLTNGNTLREQLEGKGAIFASTADTEVILHLIAREEGNIEECLRKSLRKAEGAYSLILLTPDRLIAARDPHGFRPLVVGKLGRSWMFASETAALDVVGATFVREVEPGEMVIASSAGLTSDHSLRSTNARDGRCIFEHVYFARPNSQIFGKNVYEVRKLMGKRMAQEMSGIAADIVVPVPDSGVPAAMGFSEASKIPMEMGLIRSHYSGRTFIQPHQSLRDLGVIRKLAPVHAVLRGRSIVLIDDSIVRGTTTRRIVKMLRRSKVKKIHMGVSSPAIIGPCYYGIDTPKRRELLAARVKREAIAAELGVDSLHYLSEEGLAEAVEAGSGYCRACFNRQYPSELTDVTRAAGAKS